MYNFIFDWLSFDGLILSDDIQALISCVFSLVILSFLLDIFKIIYYSIIGR